MFKDINTVVITRVNPLLIIFMLDQSESMNDAFGNVPIAKAAALSSAINRVLFEIGLKSMSEGEIVSRFEIGMFAYGNQTVNSGWQGALGNKYIQTIRNIFTNPLQINDDESMIWITPYGHGGTPMYTALKNVRDFVRDWINYGNHRQICHPPIIINITDGEATDDKEPFAGIRSVFNEIKALQTDYGSTILMNIHISGENHEKVFFPHRPVGNNPYQKLLFDISSPLYPAVIARARALKYNLQDDARGYVYNGDSSDLLHFLNIGTQAASDR
jgi:hypothetical protein